MKAGLTIRRKALVMVTLLFAGAATRVAASPEVQRPVSQFMYFYEQSEDMGLWERIAFSYIMAKAALDEDNAPAPPSI